MYRKILLLFSGNSLGTALSFLRTILIARLISLEDFGIAATFLVVVMVTRLMSNLGMQKMIIQAVDGEDQTFQNGLQGFQLLRGVVASLLLMAIAGPMARFLGNDDIVWAYQTMALAPLLGALTHFDIQRLQRRMRFGPMLLVNLVPMALSIVLVFPLFWLFGDYRVMLFVVLLTTGMRAGASHLVAERPFRCSFDVAIMRRSFAFGWPMLLNGILLALVIQGEKLIVGRELGMAMLAIFAMGASLLQAPTASMANTLNQFLLPQLSAAQNDSARFQRMAMVAVQANFFAGLCMALGVVVLGQPLVLLALGPEYQPVVLLLVYFALVEITRSSRTCTSLVSLARSKMGNGLAGNLPRVLSLPVSWYALTQGAELLGVLFIALAAELGGLAIGMVLMQRRARVALRPLAPTLAAFMLFLGALAVYGPLDSDPGVLAVTPGQAIAGLIGATLLAVGTMTTMWSYLWKREMRTF